MLDLDHCDRPEEGTPKILAIDLIVFGVISPRDLFDFLGLLFIQFK
jgi:hypothetical protein